MQQHFRVAAVGAADEQHDVGPAARSAATSARGQRPGGDVDDLGAGRQADPVPGLGRHLALVADDGEPQPAAGAGAGQHLVDPVSRGLERGRRTAR